MSCGKIFTEKTVLLKDVMDSKFTKQEKEILSKLMRWCSQAEKCPADVRRWFLQKQKPLTGIDKIIDYLIKNDFVNENRYAAAFVHDKFLFNSWGRIKIAAGLSKKQIPESIIQQAINNGINEKKYQNILRNLLEKKKKSLENKDITVIKQKIRNFAISKGFEPDFVYRETEKLINK